MKRYEIEKWVTKNGVRVPIFKKHTAEQSHQILRDSLKRNKEVRQHIKQLPSRNGWKNEVSNILTQNPELVQEAEERYQKLAQRGKLPEPVKKTVYTDTIYSRQPYLERQKLLKYSRRNDTNNKEPISGVRYKDTVILTDGNHRTALAKLRSEPTVDIEITNLDKKRLFRK